MAPGPKSMEMISEDFVLDAKGCRSSKKGSQALNALEKSKLFLGVGVEDPPGLPIGLKALRP